ncbi:MAG TPA: FHA domain-containing protein [Solirubrobacteraceae bacterium]|nr:FHA domain-containing protein [Solirubrobacteraceae bacterium]
MDDERAGAISDTGPFRCEQCQALVTLADSSAPKRCDNCGSEALSPLELPPQSTEQNVVASLRAVPPWLADPATLLVEPGEYLCYQDGEEVVVVPLTREWTRIGRSLAADVRFDDPTVSRRHALLVRAPDGVRLLDDRSLNGVFVNGQRVEWSTLAHGDEILVGRYRLHFARLEPQEAAGLEPQEAAAAAVAPSASA